MVSTDLSTVPVALLNITLDIPDWDSIRDKLDSIPRAVQDSGSGLESAAQCPANVGSGSAAARISARHAKVAERREIVGENSGVQQGESDQTQPNHQGEDI
jgi:hypothetical protein